MQQCGKTTDRHILDRAVISIALADYLEILTILVCLLTNLVHPYMESGACTLHSHYLKHAFQTLGKKLPYHIFCLHAAKIQHYLESTKHAPEKSADPFYICQSVNEGWSRNILLNYLDTDLYERQGKALTNFGQTLPDETSDLAQEITKDPYDFAFTGITGHYNEQLLKDKLLGNITQFLIELGTGFAYVGKEYRIQVGEREQFIDLLFYHLKLSCYVIIEVKIGKFDFADIGQLGGYVVSCNHILRKEGRDNPTIGLLICKEKDRIQAQYALESSSQPIAISEYDLEKFFPEKLEGVIPTIEEIETKLNEDSNNYAGSDCTNIKDKQL